MPYHGAFHCYMNGEERVTEILATARISHQADNQDQMVDQVEAHYQIPDEQSDDEAME